MTAHKIPKNLTIGSLQPEQATDMDHKLPEGRKWRHKAGQLVGGEEGSSVHE